VKKASSPEIRIAHPFFCQSSLLQFAGVPQERPEAAQVFEAAGVKLSSGSPPPSRAAKPIVNSSSSMIHRMATRPLPNESYRALRCSYPPETGAGHHVFRRGRIKCDGCRAPFHSSLAHIESLARRATPRHRKIMKGRIIQKRCSGDCGWLIRHWEISRAPARPWDRPESASR